MAAGSRRRFLGRLAYALVGALPLGLAAGCRRYTQEQIDEMRAAYDPDLRCDDISKLWPAEAETRKTNEYVQPSPKKDQFCFICSNFIKPVQPDSCATCRTVKGPIHPLGWCTSWTVQRS